MNIKRILPLALVALTAAACADQPLPTESTPTAQFARGPATSSTLLSSIPVVGTLLGGTFDGVLSLTDLSIVDGALVGSGTLTGTANIGGVVTQITQTFTDIPLDLIGGGQPGACDVLNLDLGPIFLDLLGLQVDLSAVNLDIIAQSGPGKLLGNLLCAVVHLLDQGGPLQGIQNLLNQITSLL